MSLLPTTVRAKLCRPIQPVIRTASAHTVSAYTVLKIQNTECLKWFRKVETAIR